MFMLINLSVNRINSVNEVLEHRSYYEAKRRIGQEFNKTYQSIKEYLGPSGLRAG